MNVQDTVFSMIRSYPTLYRSRVMALARLFDQFDAVWVNGELFDKEPRGNQDFLPYSVEQVTETGSDRVDRDLLFHRRENAKAQFTYDNAHLLSRDTLSSFDKTSSIRFAGRHFEDIPADITPDWLDAAKELAGIITIHKYRPDTTYAADHLERENRDLESSVKLCKQFLERFKVVTVSTWEHANRLKEVTREALALGFKLVPVEATPPECATSDAQT